MVGDREEVRRKGGVIGPRPSEEDAQGRTLAIAFARWSGRFCLADEHGHETRSQDEVFSANQCTSCRGQIGEFATPAQKICESAPLGGRNLARTRSGWSNGTGQLCLTGGGHGVARRPCCRATAAPLARRGDGFCCGVVCRAISARRSGRRAGGKLDVHQGG